MTYPFTNPPLKYGYAALEPYIDAKTMSLHHDKHLQTYVDNLNAAVKAYPALHKWELEKLIYNDDMLPEQIRTAVKNNAGGVYNHIFYFDGLSGSGAPPFGRLVGAVGREFGSFEAFKAELKKAALGVFGSGYAWLTVSGADCRLKIVTTPNQITPLDARECPILNIDVWEHAYYLKRFNLRAEYIDAYFNVIDWEEAEKRFAACAAACGGGGVGGGAASRRTMHNAQCKMHN